MREAGARATHGGRAMAGAYAIYAAAFLAIAWPWLGGSLVVPWDAKAHFYPQLQFLAQSLHAGDTPFWNPYVFAGHPQIADPQSLIFSPPFLILAALDGDPSPWAADAALFAALFVAGLALMARAFDAGWHPAAAMVAALTFAFGASAAWRIQHVGQILSLSYLPIAWWLLERALARSSMAYGIAAGAAAAVMVLGRDQVAYLGLWVLTGVVIAHWIGAPHRARAMRASLKPLAAGFATGLLLAGPPLVLTLLLYEASNRVEITLDGALKGSLHPASLLTAAVPKLFGTAGPLSAFWGPPSPAWGPLDLYLARNMGHLYIGAIPLLLLLGLGWRRGAGLAGPIRLVFILLVLMGAYALGRYTPAFGLLFDLIPGVDVFRRPADATFLMGALAAVLAGWLTHLWLTSAQLDRGRALAIAATGVALALAAAAAVAWSKDRLAYAAWPLGEAATIAALSGVALWLAARQAGRPLVAALLLATVLAGDLMRSNGPSESTALPPQVFDVLRPQTANDTIAFLKARAAGPGRPRVELLGIDFHWPNASMIHRLDHDLGYNPVRLAWYADATGAGDHIALPDQRSFSPLFPSYRSPLADLLGLAYIASRVPVEEVDRHLKPGDLELVARTGEAFIYRNSRALPRVLFANHAVTADMTELIRGGRWPTDDLVGTAVLEELPALKEDARPGTATLARYRNGEVVVTASSPDGGIVVLNDVWHPWWYASIDGRPTALLRANAIMRAVSVPAGQHELRFTFRPFKGALEQLRHMIGGSQARAGITATTVSG